MPVFSLNMFRKPQDTVRKQKRTLNRRPQFQHLDGRQMFAGDTDMALFRGAPPAADRVPVQVSAATSGNSSNLASQIVAAVQSFRSSTLDDHGNDRFSATTISMGLSFSSGSATGTIERRGDRDYFKVDLNHFFFTPNVTFSVDQSPGGTLDPIMRLLDSTGREIAMNDDFGGSRNSQITRTVTRGVYYIEVTGHSGSPTGSYTVSVRPSANTDLPDDHSGTDSTATRISMNSNVNGNIERIGDADAFALDVSRAGSHTFTVSNRLGSSLQPFIRLTNSSGSELISARAESGNTATVTLNLSPGRYFATVFGYGSTTGGYSIRASNVGNVSPLADDHENVDLNRATEIPVSGLTVNSISGSASGVIERVGDLDLFRFNNSGVNFANQKSFTIDVTSASGSRLDPYVELLDQRGNLIAGNDDFGGGLNSRLVQSLSNGYFYIRVKGVSSTTGAYTVSVRGVSGTIDNTGRERLNLDRNHFVRDNDQTRNRRKEYVVQATRTGTFSIDVDSRGYGQQLRSPRIEVYDSNNRLIASSPQGSVHGNSLRVNLTQGHDYRISVIGSSGDGAFRLEMAG